MARGACQCRIAEKTASSYLYPTRSRESSIEIDNGGAQRDIDLDLYRYAGMGPLVQDEFRDGTVLGLHVENEKAEDEEPRRVLGGEVREEGPTERDSTRYDLIVEYAGDE